MTWVPFRSKVFGHDGAFSVEPVGEGEACWVHEIVALKRLSVTTIDRKFFNLPKISTSFEISPQLSSNNHVLSTSESMDLNTQTNGAEIFQGDQKEFTSRLQAYAAISDCFGSN